MKKLIILAICMMAMTIGCKNKGQTADADADSTVVDSVLAELNDTTPLPMFLYYMNPQYMQTVYWTDIKEPKKDEDNANYFNEIHTSWSLQDMSRRNAADYTKMLVGEKWVDIKYIGEVLKNPDGEEMYGGELHSRTSIPSPGLKYALVNSKDALKKDYNYGEFYLIVHQDYLTSRKMLKCEYLQSEKPLPQTVIKKMEQKYNMKAKHSQLCAKIDGRYSQGYIQFIGEYKNAPKDNNRDYKKALALEVIVKGDSIFTEEVIGYYDEESKTCTWNADDGGDYCSVGIHAAFEGPQGLEICYERGAPESRTVGIWFLRNGEIINQQYECYHAMVDEQTPLWKKDIAQMQKLFQNSLKGNKNPLTKYQFLYLDDDNVEEIWMRTEDNRRGAVFTFKDRKPQLIATEDEKSTLTFISEKGKGCVKVTHEEGNFTSMKLFILKGSQVVERFALQDLDGEITDAELNGKTLTKWEAADYLDKTPSEVYDTGNYFINIDKEKF
ncbi:MAG: hypothetical protein IJV17_07195 [Prevotella sp.]|nr:hypothetical protein [Prevotella sp.]